MTENRYRTFVPIINSVSDERNRPIYLDKLKQCKAERVFIVSGGALPDDSARAKEMALLAKNIAYYQENGFEVGIWFNALGHGGTLPTVFQEKAKVFTRIVDLRTGKASDDSFCPLCEHFKKNYYAYTKAVATLSPDLIMIDDDFRMAFHGAALVGCGCDLHMQDISRRLGEKITREELARKAMEGGRNRYRDAWLDSVGDSMRDFCRGLREVVDSVNPAIRLGHCSCFSTWDLDGVDNIELSRILAGRTRPFLRFIGAPYWYHFGNWCNSLGNIIELERMQQHWCEQFAPEIEIFSESDTHPRPRYVVPSAYVENFDGALRASGGMNGILKYIAYDDPHYESGYMERHIKHLPELEAISAMFKDGKNVGIHLFEPMHKLRERDFSVTAQTNILECFFPISQRLQCATSIPATYEERDDGYPLIVFGDNARYLPQWSEQMPLILDVEAARILMDQGEDVGLLEVKSSKEPQFETFDAFTVSLAEKGQFYYLHMKDGAQTLSTFNGCDDFPAAVRYENQKGRRFLIYAFDANSNDGRGNLFKSYGRQGQLIEAVKWLTKGRALPASLPNCPGVYMLCKKNEGALTVGIWNLWPDFIPDPVIELDDIYSEVEFIGGSGHIEDNRVCLDNILPGYAFTGFKVTK